MRAMDRRLRPAVGELRPQGLEQSAPPGRASRELTTRVPNSGCRMGSPRRAAQGVHPSLALVTLGAAKVYACLRFARYVSIARSQRQRRGTALWGEMISQTTDAKERWSAAWRRGSGLGSGSSLRKSMCFGGAPGTLGVVARVIVYRKRSRQIPASGERAIRTRR